MRIEDPDLICIIVLLLNYVGLFALAHNVLLTLNIVYPITSEQCGINRDH